MRCQTCKTDVFHLGSGALKARTRMLVVRDGRALVLVCPVCRSDVQIGLLDEASAAAMEQERAALVRLAHTRNTTQLTEVFPAAELPQGQLGT
jgi:hypothetical protein